MTRWRADRPDRPAVDLEAGRRHAPPRSRVMSKTRAEILEVLGCPAAGRYGSPGMPSVRTPRLQSNLTRSLKKVPMTSTLTNIKAQQRNNDLLREAQRRPRPVEVRRVAVIRPEGAHFKLRPIRASLEATRS